MKKTQISKEFRDKIVNDFYVKSKTYSYVIEAKGNNGEKIKLNVFYNLKNKEYYTGYFNEKGLPYSIGSLSGLTHGLMSSMNKESVNSLSNEYATNPDLIKII